MPDKKGEATMKLLKLISAELKFPVQGAAILGLFLLTPFVLLISRETLRADIQSTQAFRDVQRTGGGEGKGTQTAAKNRANELSDAELYVREMLEDYLQPSKIEFLEDGRVEFTLDFRKKYSEHEDLFTPRVARDLRKTFRWSVGREQYYFDRRSYGGGLRISDRGMAVLKCWFEDDVEAEILYESGTNFNPNQVVAVAYCTKRGAIGSNFGSQCVAFRGGSRAKKKKGKTVAINNRSGAWFKVVVRNGMFDAHRDGRLKNSMKYPQKGFESGRIGFIWGARSSGLICELRIKGRIDVEATVKEMQKARGSR